ncbi:diphthine synthase [Sulfurisphaera ohwakuensis]|uniref:Diphthine synthase n=1 Tax=Sulfurisphaera ohwakuensis TaxID=69656 RepID=A0A650CGP3_SULOH|nr:diphthine synthase [Sulfurisphaera ohwakuensis]MBB5252531.1 diphthine synthase [Sulfurisphaera ohwakuensis]QGR17024.1 diphthine synthase [Sulfurisphaera ohwakuensis]
MPTLKLIGLGLSAKFVTREAIDEISKCNVVLFESYTSLSCDINLDFIKFLNKNVIIVDRKFIENNIKEIIKLLKEKEDVCIVTIGDPMIATTHVSLIVEVKDKGYNFKVIPGISVHCYIISKSMLSSYKFGKSVTITYPYNNKIDTTPYDVIYDNFIRGLHTILYLDLKEDKIMTAKEAVELLIEMEKIKKQGLISDDRIIIVGQRLGCDDEEVVALRLKEVFNYKFKEPPHIIVFPTDKLHFMEVEALKCLMK